MRWPISRTGRESYRHLQSTPLIEASLREVTGGLLASSLVQATAAQVASAISPALDRAYAVAWALRGPAAQRAAARAPLGWIAVSGEDDKPHRPTNVPPPSLKLQDNSTITLSNTRTPPRAGSQVACRTGICRKPFLTRYLRRRGGPTHPRASGPVGVAGDATKSVTGSRGLAGVASLPLTYHPVPDIA